LINEDEESPRLRLTILAPAFIICTMAFESSSGVLLGTVLLSSLIISCSSENIGYNITSQLGQIAVATQLAMVNYLKTNRLYLECEFVLELGFPGLY
jgi:hypothetical protein